MVKYSPNFKKHPKNLRVNSKGPIIRVYKHPWLLVRLAKTLPPLFHNLPLDTNKCSWYNYHIATNRVVRSVKGMDVLDYKRKIMEMLDNADDRRLRLIYIYIKAILGLN